MGTRADLKKKFKPYPLPDALGSLADYWDGHPVFFSGSFEVTTDPYDMLGAWFRKAQAGIDRIRIFGHDGVGSLIGLWFYEGLSGEPPVVFLGGEGEGNTILASCAEEFLSILGTNRDWEPFDQNYTEPETSNEEEAAHFCAWLAAKGITPANNPLSITKKARKKHPDFPGWLKSVRPER